MRTGNKTCGQSQKKASSERSHSHMNRYAYTPITGDPIRLSLSGCADWGDLHRRIRETFGFPAFYGENWDAMWDCLTDVFPQRGQYGTTLKPSYRSFFLKISFSAHHSDSI